MSDVLLTTDGREVARLAAELTDEMIEAGRVGEIETPTPAQTKAFADELRSRLSRRGSKAEATETLAFEEKPGWRDSKGQWKKQPELHPWQEAGQKQFDDEKADKYDDVGPQYEAIGYFDGPGTFGRMQNAARDPDGLVDYLQQPQVMPGMPGMDEYTDGLSKEEAEKEASVVWRNVLWADDYIKQEKSSVDEAVAVWGDEDPELAATGVVRLTGHDFLPSDAQKQLDDGQTVEFTDSGYLAGGSLDLAETVARHWIARGVGEGPKHLWFVKSGEGTPSPWQNEELIFPRGSHVRLRQMTQEEEDALPSAIWDAMDQPASVVNPPFYIAEIL